ncbi:MAG: hypothetical protein V4614_03845 [Pseudomonadota bacterium]
MLKHIKFILRACLIAPLLLILLFEEWGWEPLARGFAALGRHRAWGALERRIRTLPPWAALLAFGIPVLALLPIKLFALYLFAEGHFATGFVLVASAKIAGTALAARLFQLTEPSLLKIRWFARLYLPWKAWKDRKLAQLRASAPWQRLQVLKNRVKLWATRTWRALKTALH